MEEFRTRPIEGEHPYLWLDATFHKGSRGRPGDLACRRHRRRVGVNTDGWRQVLGTDVGPSEDEAFWTRFLHSLVRRGLRGELLVISDAHEGLKRAISKILHGAAWQRCRTDFMLGVPLPLPEVALQVA